MLVKVCLNTLTVFQHTDFSSNHKTLISVSSRCFLYNSTHPPVTDYNTLISLLLPISVSCKAVSPWKNQCFSKTLMQVS